MAIKKGNYYSKGKGELSDAKINTVVYLSNQGKMIKIKELIGKIRNDSSVTKKDALHQIKAIVEEKNEDLWKEAQSGKLENVKASEIKKVDMEKVKANLELISEYCVKNVNNTMISKNQTLDVIKNMCNNSSKKEWSPVTL